MKNRRFIILFAVVLVLLLCADNSFAIWPFGKKRAEQKEQPAEMITEKEPVAKHKSASVQFKEAQDILISADQARDEKRFTDALAFYESALTYYKRLANNYPDHESGVTRFRVIYCSNQIQDLKTEIGSNDNTVTPPSNKTERNILMDREVTEIMQPVPVSNKGIQEIVARAKALLHKNEPEKAYQILKQGLRTNPDNQDIRLLAGIILCDMGKYDNAMYLLESLEEEDPANVYIHLALGTAYFGSAIYSKAIMEMKYALNLDPKLQEAHFNLAQILLAQDPTDKATALSHYKSSLQLGGKRNKDLEKLLK